MAAFYIQNPWTGLVIDIGENAQKPSPGTLLRANTKMTSAPGNWYQLWTFSSPFFPTPGSIPYYWLQNANGNLTKSPLVIDIEESGNLISVPGRPDTLKQGSPLDAWTQKNPQGHDLNAGKTGASNQLWSFAQDKASGYYYISNHLTGFVIDIAEGPSGKQPTAGVYLDAWTLKGSSPENNNQLWQFVDVNGATVPAPSETPVDSGTVKPGGVQL
ncbi:MAG TPA: RICIN domain-containing protein [Xanthobacteraceae bacterium]|nr:RICIN domain-containing protein [Xanthobacteraceae bacterium]